MKRILIFSAFFLPHIGGVENNTYELSRRLAERDYEVDILTTNTENSPADEQIDDIHIYRLPCWNILGGTYPIPKPSLAGLSIMRKLLQNKYATINTNTRFFPTSAVGLIFSWVRRIPMIHTEHGASHSVVSNRLICFLSTTYDHTIGTVLVRSAKVNIGVSEAASAFLRHLGARNIRVIPNGIDTDVFSPKLTNCRQELGISEDTIVITFVGRLIPAKGIQDVISVLPDIQQAFSNVAFLVVGDGPYKADLMNMTLKNNCSMNTYFLGQKSQNDVIRILSITDVFVNPSYSEGLPTTVLEAASMELPIIATDVGGTREIIMDGNTGLLVNAKDKDQLKKKLCELIADPEISREFADNARKLVMRKFEWRQTTQGLVDILTEISKN